MLRKITLAMVYKDGLREKDTNAEISVTGRGPKLISWQGERKEKRWFNGLR